MATRVGTEFLVNSTTANGQRYPSSAALANGGFVVTFDDNSEVGGAGIRFRLFDAAGAAIGLDATKKATNPPPSIAIEGVIVFGGDWLSNTLPG